MTAYRLNKDEILLVKGPAIARARSGCLSVLGIHMGIDSEIIVRKNKIIPFEADENDSLIQLILGEKGESWITHDRVGMKVWKDLEVFTNLKPGKNKLMIIGETDSGKSTLTSYLANIALMRHLTTVIIDGDIGQGDLAPPGCIGTAVVRNRIYDLRDLRADMLGFVGFTSISYRLVEDLIIKRMKRAISYFEEKDYDLCIINTDGYVTNKGMDYKIDMIQELGPDIVICFKEYDLNLLKRLKEFDYPPVVISADKPDGVIKSASERSERRLSQYFRFLKNGEEFNVDLNKVRLSFTADNKIIVFRPNVEDVIKIFNRFIIFNSSSLNGMFVGLGSGDDVYGFARIIKLYPDQIATICTNIKGKFDTLFLSTIRISSDLRAESIIPIILNPLRG